MTAATHRNRDPVPLPPYSVETIGMSPKKAHEVARMVAYLKHVYLPALQGKGKVGIVDVGSGQGYLCRAMASELGLNVLGLDGNQVQTDGAEMWSDGRRGKKRSVNKAGGKVKYKTMRIDKATDIVDAVGEWLGPIQDSDSSPHQVVLVALHACGSLTPHIIRACLGTTPANRAWSFAGAVAVGCCYNLLNDSDFPLSQTYKSPTNKRAQHLGLDLQNLPTCAFHLATQTPHRWNDTPETQRKARLALRKIVFRALWGRATAQVVSSPGGTGEVGWSKNLGRANDKVYESWDTFIRYAIERTRIPPFEQGYDAQEARRLETLHVLRCEAGRTVEDLILDDREMWIRELLADQGRGDRKSVV